MQSLISMAMGIPNWLLGPTAMAILSKAALRAKMVPCIYYFLATMAHSKILCDSRIEIRLQRSISWTPIPSLVQQLPYSARMH
mmetsp:Transcript_4383/g.9569  ORF Transcript_4383/g.9569 Transcript_4383/m.9569 type:complete len:83 (-) Transcript_4383:825-1073(-)